MPFSYMGPCPYPPGLMLPHMQYQMNRNLYRGIGPPMIHPGIGPIMHSVSIPGQFQACHQLPPLAIDIRRNQNPLSENLNQQQFVQNFSLNKNEQNLQLNKINAKRPISKSVSPLKKNSVISNSFIINFFYT